MVVAAQQPRLLRNLVLQRIESSTSPSGMHLMQKLIIQRDLQE